MSSQLKGKKKKKKKNVVKHGLIHRWPGEEKNERDALTRARALLQFCDWAPARVSGTLGVFAAHSTSAREAPAGSLELGFAALPAPAQGSGARASG